MSPGGLSHDVIVPARKTVSTPLPSVTGSEGKTLLNLMDESAKPQYLLFKASIAIGLLLGVLLLGQTVLTYRFVKTGMVRQEARREADRRVQSLIASSRLAGNRDAATLLPVDRRSGQGGTAAVRLGSSAEDGWHGNRSER